VDVSELTSHVASASAEVVLVCEEKKGERTERGFTTSHHVIKGNYRQARPGVDIILVLNFGQRL